MAGMTIQAYGKWLAKITTQRPWEKSTTWHRKTGWFCRRTSCYWQV